MTPELHRPVALDRIGPRGLDLVVAASPEECVALAERLAVPGVLELRCTFALTLASGASVEARGHLQARVVQTCVISLDEFESEVDEVFSLRFVPAGTETDDPDPEADDEIPYTGTMLDLGEAAAEQLALALDAYPRKPDAALPDTDVEVSRHPFAGLSALRRTD